MIRLARTIRHLVRALNQIEDEIKWKDLAKVISIDADKLAELVILDDNKRQHGGKNH